MTGKHRRPRSTGRTLAATAAVLTAGALPLAAAGTAFAAAAQPEPSAAAGLSASPLSNLTEKTAELGGKVQVLSAKADRLEQQAGQLADQLGTGGPVKSVLHDIVPPTTNAVPGEVAPAVLRNGAVGRLTGGVGLQTEQMARNVVDQARPMADQLRQGGVPTVGEMTSSLSRTGMPVFGTVGGLTSAVPVGAVLGTPVMNTLGAAGAL